MSDHEPSDDFAGGVLGAALLGAARAARLGVVVARVDDGVLRCTYVSDDAADVLGRPVADLLGGDPTTGVAAEDAPRLREAWIDHARAGRPASRYEVTAIRRSGERVAIEISLNAVSAPPRSGESSEATAAQAGVVALVADVSARKAAEEAQVRTEARFRELIEIAPEPIGIIHDGRFIYANRAYVEAVGYPDADTFYAAPLSALVHADDHSLLAARQKQLLERGGQTSPHTYRVHRYDGSIVRLETSSVPFDYRGQPSILTMARDVTARKALEAQLVQADRLAALGTLAAGVAHEINNPLAYVMLNLDWIARKLPEVTREPESLGSLAELLQEALRGAERVASIVRELRSFSRADGETRRGVDLASVVQSSIKIASHEIRHRARVATAFEPVRAVWANESRLEQVVLNLLLNAAQAMPEGRLEQNEIRVVVRPDGDGRAVLEVSDNGVGIPAEALQRIFDPFFTTKPPGIGTGLGLSICHGIVTSLGGQITVHSEPNVGTSFRVVLPTTDVPEPDVKTSEDGLPDEVPSSVPARRARVLVVDDELPIAHTMRDLLGAEHDVTVCTSGRDALALALSGAEFDVVFCDLMMPGMSGADLYERLRDERPGFERRIVFMTGGAFTTRAAEFLASVDNRRIEKPFSLGLVERIVREMASHPR